MEKNVWRLWRDATGKTQRQIAEAFDPPLTPATVSAWENGVAVPTPSLVDEVSRVYGKTADKVLHAIHSYHRAKAATALAK